MLGVLGVAQRVAHLVPLRGKERKAHGAADDHNVGERQEAVDDGDLVGHLRSADDRDEWPLWILQDAVQRAHLAFQQAPSGARQQVGYARRAGVRTVGGAKRVIDIGLSERCERARQLGIVGGLAGLEAHVLKHEDLAVGELLRELACASPNDFGGKCDAGASQLAQALHHRGERQVGLGPALWTPEVRHEHQPRVAFAQLFDRWERLHDAGVVGHHPRTGVIGAHRHVEVHAHQYAPPVHVELIEAPHRFSTLTSRDLIVLVIPVSLGTVTVWLVILVIRAASADRRVGVLTGPSAPGRPGDWSSPTRCRTTRRPSASCRR